MQRPSVAALAIALFVTSGSSLAQDASSAEAMFRAGRDAMRAGDYERACEQFRKSDGLDPQPGTKLNLGGCEEKRGRLAAALGLFRAVLQELPANDPRAAIAKERVAALEAAVPQVTFELSPGAPASTTVRLDTLNEAPALGVALPLDPGKHQVTVSAPGFEDKRFELALAKSERRAVEVAPGAKLGGGAPVAVDQDTASESGSNKTLGYVFGGIGVVGVVVGSVAGIMVLGKKQIEDDECDHDLERCSQKGADAQDAGRTLGVVSTVGFIVGAVGIGAGAYFLLSSDGSGKETGLAVRARPSGTFVSLEQTW